MKAYIIFYGIKRKCQIGTIEKIIFTRLMPILRVLFTKRVLSVIMLLFNYYSAILHQFIYIQLIVV